jgi:hypothetical protein
MGTKLENQMKDVIKGFIEEDQAENAICDVDNMFQMAVTTEEFADMEQLQKRNYVNTYKNVRALLLGIAKIEEEVNHAN